MEGKTKPVIKLIIHPLALKPTGIVAREEVENGFV
jgi:hypothetical protein